MKLMKKLKPLVATIATTILVSACTTAPISPHHNEAKPTVNTASTSSQDPIVFKEPSLPTPFYALNPFDYDAPPIFEVDLKKAASSPVTTMVATNSADPSKTITLTTNRLIIPTINNHRPSMKFVPLAGQDEIDVTAIDDFLQLTEGQARHYPPHFKDKNTRRGFEGKLRQTTQFLDSYAEKDNASYDILMRAFKASVMARNLDLGQQYTTKSLKYAQRLLKMNPNDTTTNLWFGFNLSEGGGQREAIPYLNKAMKDGVQEAYLASVNNYLFLEQKKNALTTLNNYKVKYPEEKQVADRLIKEINTQGRTNVWEDLLLTNKQGR